jgi:aminomethyltransferase
MGEVTVKGKDAERYVNHIFTNDVSQMEPGKILYGMMCYDDGGVVDDLLVYKMAEGDFFLVINASNIDKDWAWIQLQAEGFDVELCNCSDDYGQLAVQGPEAEAVMEEVLNIRCKELTFYTFKTIGDVIVSRTGYTGEDGFEILVENELAEFLWDKILEEGQEFGIKPIGLGARDTLRLEAGLHLYGNDLGESTTPIEAGLSWSVPKDKTADYNGKEVIMNQIQNGVQRKLIGLEMLDKNIPRHEYEVYFNGEKVGHVTSGGVAPTAGKNIALAYVKNLPEICTDSTVQVMIREKLHDARVVKRPFVQKRNRV